MFSALNYVLELFATTVYCTLELSILYVLELFATTVYCILELSILYVLESSCYVAWYVTDAGKTYGLTKKFAIRD